MKSKNQNKGIATVTFLGRDQVDYLDKLAKDSSFRYGHKLTRTKVLSEMVNFLRKMKINLSDIDLNTESFSDGLMRIIQRTYYKEAFSAEDILALENQEVVQVQKEGK